jgi:hypothetical protein
VVDSNKWRLLWSRSENKLRAHISFLNSGIWRQICSFLASFIRVSCWNWKYFIWRGIQNSWHWHFYWLPLQPFSLFILSILSTRRMNVVSLLSVFCLNGFFVLCLRMCWLCTETNKERMNFMLNSKSPLPRSMSCLDYRLMLMLWDPTV